MNQRFFEFGTFRVDPVERVLWRDGQPVSLTPKVFDLLLLLLESHGHVVEKERLMHEIWPGTFVEEGNLTQNISVLRKILGESGNDHQYIQTVARRGYRFVGHVVEVFDEVEEAPIAVEKRRGTPRLLSRILVLAAGLLVAVGCVAGYVLAKKYTQRDQTHVAHPATANPEAYELYLRGKFHLNQFSEDGTRLARQYFEQALQKDAQYAPGYAGLAESYAFGEIGLPPNEALPKARRAAEKAIALDDKLGEAHAALAQVAFLWDWDWSTADQQFKRALELSPGNPEIHHMYAHYLTAMERFDEGLAESQRYLELEPLSPASRNHLGWHYLYSKQFDKAIKQYKLVLEMDPNFTEAHRQLAETYWNVNMYEAAAAEVYKRYELLGRGEDGTVLKQAYVKAGWNGLWQKRHLMLLERSKQGSVNPTGVACSYGGLNNERQVMEWLERAYREHDPDLVYLRVDNCWNRVRHDSQFQVLLKKMKLSSGTDSIGYLGQSN